jgi:hypothetical protein
MCEEMEDRRTLHSDKAVTQLIERLRDAASQRQGDGAVHECSPALSRRELSVSLDIVRRWVREGGRGRTIWFMKGKAMTPTTGTFL